MTVLQLVRRVILIIAAVLGVAWATPAFPSAQGVLKDVHDCNPSPHGSTPMAPPFQAGDGNYYGTTAGGGAFGNGTVYRISPAGILTTIYSFSGPDGSYPNGVLVQGSDGNLYGVTKYGGTSNDGTVYKLSLTGVLTTIHSFNGTDGSYPQWGLVLGADGNLYGAAEYGGVKNNGTIFQRNSSTGFNSLHLFSGSDGSVPIGQLVAKSDGTICGTAIAGGAKGNGIIYSITSTGALSTLYTFTGGHDGGSPYGGLTLGADGNLYGTTESGGDDSDGVFYELSSTGFSTLHTFTGQFLGDQSYGPLVEGADHNFYSTTVQGGSADLGTVFEVTKAGGFTILYNFTASSGDYAALGLSLGSDGNFHGATTVGGAYGVGTVFTITRGGSLTTQYSFSGLGDYIGPNNLIQGTDGYLYGTASYGVGISIIKVSTTGDSTILYSFSGYVNVTGLLQGADGKLYGASSNGGSYGRGSIFALSPSGVLTTLYSFSPVDGVSPESLIQGSDGNLYGTTYNSTFTSGSLFKVTLPNTLTTIYTFPTTIPTSALVEGPGDLFYGLDSSGDFYRVDTNGNSASRATISLPADTGIGSLRLGSDGNFYATTYYFGNSPLPNSTIYGLNPSGLTWTVCNVPQVITNSLVQGADGNLYGLAVSGTYSTALIFEATLAGVYSDVYDFSNGIDGNNPVGANALVKGFDGNLYGSTGAGGLHNYGSVFEFLTPSSLAAKPTAPSGLSAVTASHQVSLTWNASAGSVTYNVYRGTSPGHEGVTPIATSLADTAYVDTHVSNGTTYYYLVAGVDSVGASAKSAEISATPLGNPAGLVGASANHLVALTWVAAGGATAYNIYRGTLAGHEGVTPIGTVSTPAYMDTHVSNGDAYYYRVVAVNASGTSARSNEASATPLGVVSGVTATAGIAQVTITWTAPAGATSYSIYRGTTPGGEGATPVGTATGSPFIDTGLTSGTKYYYKVAASNATGSSALSPETSATAK